MFKLTKNELKWCSNEFLFKLDIKIHDSKLYVSNIHVTSMTLHDAEDEEFTRSVIKCSARYLESQNWSHVEYRPETKCLVFIYAQTIMPNYRRYMNCISPDLSNEYKEWTNKWVNQ